MNKKKAVATFLDDDTIEQLKILCKEENRALSNLLRKIIKEYVRNSGKTV